MNAVVHHHARDVVAQPERMPAPASAGDTVMAQILRLASDPSIDLDRVDKLMAMHERMEKNQAEREFSAALARMQGEMPLVAQGGYDTHKKIAYSRLEDVMKAARPAMERHGFAITFDITHEPNAVTVTGHLIHSAGHKVSSEPRRYPVDTGPGRSAIQALGSSETYGRRYVMMSLLNIASDKDDDGRGGSEKPEEPKLSEDQVDNLRDLLASVKKTETALLKWAGFSALADIPARRFDEMCRAISQKGARR